MKGKKTFDFDWDSYINEGFNEYQEENQEQNREKEETEIIHAMRKFVGIE